MTESLPTRRLGNPNSGQLPERALRSPACILKKLPFSLSLTALRFLQVNTTVCSLSVADNGVSDPGFQALGRLLLRTPTLNRLDVSCNCAAHPASSALSRALATRSCRLTSLHLKNCKLGDREITEFAESLNNNGVLAVLDVSDNRISDRGAAALAHMLCANSYLEVLSPIRAFWTNPRSRQKNLAPSF